LSENFDLAKIKSAGPDGYQAIGQYQRPSVWKASWQLANTLIPYLLLCLLMVFAFRAGVSYGFILGLTVVAAALLVRIFTFFHIHHLRPRIPNYNLQRCYDATPSLSAVKPLTLFKSFKCLQLKLWDEKKQKLVGFRSI